MRAVDDTVLVNRSLRQARLDSFSSQESDTSRPSDRLGRDQSRLPDMCVHSLAKKTASQDVRSIQCGREVPRNLDRSSNTGGTIPIHQRIASVPEISPGALRKFVSMNFRHAMKF